MAYRETKRLGRAGHKGPFEVETTRRFKHIPSQLAANDQGVICACRFRYVEEHVQRTGVAIETQGFTFVTSGRKRESLTVRSKPSCWRKILGIRGLRGVWFLIMRNFVVTHVWLHNFVATLGFTTEAILFWPFSGLSPSPPNR